MKSSHIRAIDQVHCHPPRLSAIRACTKGKTAPPNTPIMNTPEAFEVYFDKPATARVKMHPHITEWSKPTDTNIHRLSSTIAKNTSTAAIEVVAISNRRGGIFGKKEKTILPIIMPPQ